MALFVVRFGIHYVTSFDVFLDFVTIADRRILRRFLNIPNENAFQAFCQNLITFLSWLAILYFLLNHLNPQNMFVLVPQLLVNQDNHWFFVVLLEALLIGHLKIKGHSLNLEK